MPTVESVVAPRRSPSACSEITIPAPAQRVIGVVVSSGQLGYRPSPTTVAGYLRTAYRQRHSHRRCLCDQGAQRLPRTLSMAGTVVLPQLGVAAVGRTNSVFPRRRPALPTCKQRWLRRKRLKSTSLPTSSSPNSAATIPPGPPQSQCTLTSITTDCVGAKQGRVFPSQLNEWENTRGPPTHPHPPLCPSYAARLPVRSISMVPCMLYSPSAVLCRLHVHTHTFSGPLHVQIVYSAHFCGAPELVAPHAQPRLQQQHHHSETTPQVAA